MEGQVVLPHGPRLVHGGPGLDVGFEAGQVRPAVRDVAEAVRDTAKGDGGHEHSVVLALRGPQLTYAQPVEERRHAAARLLVVDLLWVVDDRGSRR